MEDLAQYKYNDYTSEEKKINNIHDKLFWDILSDKNEMEQFLNNYLEINIKSEELENYNSSFVTKKYQNKESDIVYKVKNKNLFILIEHQSVVDKTMPLRLMEYSIEIIRNEIKNSKLNKYPKVIPIVLYTGDDNCSIENKYRKLEAYIGYNGIEDLGIDLKYNLIDINKLNIEELQKQNNILSKAIIIEKCKTRELMLKYLRPTIENIKNEQKEKMEQIIKYALREILDKEDIEQLLKELYKESEGKGMNLLTANMKREKEGWERSARQEGRQEGIRFIIHSMKKKGIEIKTISSLTGLKIEEIESM